MVKISARDLAQFCCREGDIHYRFEESTRADEGIATQKRLQQTRLSEDGYQREVGVTCDLRIGRRSVAISGRIDGCDFTGEDPLLEEFKTTRIEPLAMHAHAGAIHVGQLKLYAGLLIAAGNESKWFRLRLLYCHPDTLAVTTFDTRMSAAELSQFLERCLRRFVLAIARLDRHRRRRNRALKVLEFPFASFRDSQRQLAREVYRAVRDGGALIAEAPTGAGKTAGVLFPALRAMGDDKIDRAVFVTSRGTGANAALESLRQLRPSAGPMRATVITAKNKICFQPEPICDPDLCEFARGYYDRLPSALSDVLASGVIDRSEVERVARLHRVCPFELSLDAAAWSDVVVCDYNYVFDPVVRFQRLQGTTRDRTALLVDEAHQLGDRVRDSLSAIVDRSMVANALAEQLAAPVRRAIESFDRKAMAFKRVHVRECGQRADDYECAVPLPQGLLRAAQGVFEAHLGEPHAMEGGSALRSLTFALSRLLRTESWYSPERFAVFLRGDRSRWSLDVRCLDPGHHIAESLAAFHAHVRFSATLKPLALYARLHGVPEPKSLQLPSPFDAGQLRVVVVPDVSVRYRNRRQSLDRLLSVIEAVVRARDGNYIVALPSFDYLELVSAAFSERNPGHDCITQLRTMDESQRRAFLDRFESSANPLLGFIVLGGMFAESVDLPGDRLIGMVVVGLGLPPPSLERQHLEACFGDLGVTAAYEQPAMTRVVQAAGRIIRTESDRGVLCLIDDRYLQANYRRYLPPHWRPSVARADEVTATLYAFWNKG